MTAPQLELDAVIVGDESDAWEDAGFTVEGGRVDVAGLTIECRGDGSAPRWRLRDHDGAERSDLDGIATEWTDEATTGDTTPHANRVVALDHLVVASPDLDRTTNAFADCGVDCRRIRDVPGSDPAMQQRFFRLGPTIIELVGRANRSGTGPASIWGLAFTVDDIDAATAHLGPACGAPKDAVQPGRRIATVRTRDLGISLPIALMTPDPRRA